MAEETKKAAKPETKAVAKTEKKPNIFKRMWRKIKETFSELKKVTWPTFGKTVQNTCVVLVVVAIFLVVISAFNVGLLELFKLLTRT